MAEEEEEEEQEEEEDENKRIRPRERALGQKILSVSFYGCPCFKNPVHIQARKVCEYVS